MEPKTIYALLKYCNNRQLRFDAWNRWISKASFEHDLYNNSIIIEEIRHNKYFLIIINKNLLVFFSDGLAKLLGYSSIAEHRLANKMAGSSETVRNFLNE